jgi:hypothetical protein
VHWWEALSGFCGVSGSLSFRFFGVGATGCEGLLGIFQESGESSAIRELSFRSSELGFATIEQNCEEFFGKSAGLCRTVQTISL